MYATSAPTSKHGLKAAPAQLAQRFESAAMQTTNNRSFSVIYCGNPCAAERRYKMKNPDSHQASSGFEQMSFLPVQDFTPKSCPRFLKCNAPICPLDADWQKRVFLKEDPTCFFLTESVKHGAETVLEGAWLKALYWAMVFVCPPITARHSRIQKALERAKLSGSRMTRFQAGAQRKGCEHEA